MNKRSVFGKIRDFFKVNKSLFDYLLILAIGLHIFIGLEKGLLYIGGDTGIPLNPRQNFNLLYLWSTQEGGVAGLNLGYVFLLAFFYFFEKIGLTIPSIQHFYIYLSHTFAGIFMYYLVSSFSIRRKRLIALISAIFYMFSPWFINYLGIFVFLPYTFIPLTLALFVRGISGRMNKLMAILLIVLSFFGIVVNFPQYSMYFVAVLLMFLYVLFHVFIGKNKFLPAFKFCLSLAVVMFLTSLWFILPYLSFFSLSGIGSELKEVVLVSGAMHNFGDYGFSTILHLIRMFGAAGFLAGGATYSDPYLSNPLLILLSYIVPLFAFSALIFRPKSKSVLFFSLVGLLFIFIAKGINSPFGRLHFWLVTNIPLARAFRTTWNLSLGANIAYAYLVAVGVVELAERLSKKNPSKFRLIVFGCISLIVINSWPLISGDYFKMKWNPPSFEGVKIPLPYYQLKDYLSKEETDYRLFRIPTSKGMINTNWGYSGSDFSFLLFPKPFISAHPLGRSTAGLVKGVYDRIRGKYLIDEGLLKIMGFLNIKNILFDGYDDTTKFRVEKEISEQFGVKPEKVMGRFSLYGLSEEHFLPHFYIPEKIVFTNTQPYDFLDLVTLPHYLTKSAILPISVKEEKFVIKPQETELVIAADSTISLDLESKKQRILDIVESQTKGVFLPYARWRPGSLFYPLVKKKEELSLKKEAKSPYEIIENNLLLAAKRIVELSHWGTTLNEAQWREISSNYYQAMDRVVSELKDMEEKGDKIQFIEYLAKAETALLAHQERIEETTTLKGGYFERKAAIDQAFDKLRAKIDEINELPDLLTIGYYFDIPEESNYEIFLKEPEGFFPEMSAAFSGIKVDGEDISMDLPRTYKEGRHQIQISFQESDNLLSENGWLEESIPLLEKKEGLIVFHFFPLPWEKPPVLYQKISKYMPDAFYKLRFEYSSLSDKAAVAIVQDVDADLETKNVSPLLFRHLPGGSDGAFQHFETVFKSHPDSRQANIYFLIMGGGEETGDIKFKNVKLQQLFNPKVILRKKIPASEKDSLLLPKMTFQKINQTKYRVFIENAYYPFPLIFSETFHPGWKVYLARTDSKGKPDKTIIASYFDGQIKEMSHQNIFLNKATFETWGLKPIVEKTHQFVNGYANLWHISPQDTGGKSDYELIIEFNPQKLFYIGMIISSLSFILGVLFLIFKNMGKYKK